MRIERVVVNASPLICLGKSGLSEILPALFSDIIVPAAVHKEISAKEDITLACAPLFAHKNVKIAGDIVIPSSVISWDLSEGAMTKSPVPCCEAMFGMEYHVEERSQQHDGMSMPLAREPSGCISSTGTPERVLEEGCRRACSRKSPP